MASKRRLRRNQCGSKHRYASPADARDGAKALRRDKGEKWINTYECDSCKGFHIGHAPRKVRQQQLAAKEERLDQR